MQTIARSQHLALYLTAWMMAGLLLACRPQAPAGPVEEPSSVINPSAMLGRSEHKVVSQAFRGGEATAVMGRLEIDLRQAKPAKGRAKLDVVVWWGALDLRVPENWRVVNDATVLMGKVEDRSKTPPPDARETLILDGLVVGGAVRIEN
jgi:hypothetical protein